MGSWSKKIIERADNLKNRVEQDEMVIHLNQASFNNETIKYGLDKNKKIVWNASLSFDSKLLCLIDLMIDYFELISKSASGKGSLREFDFYLRDQTNVSSWVGEESFNDFLSKNLELLQQLFEYYAREKEEVSYLSELIKMRMHFEQFCDPHKIQLKLVDFKKQKLVFGVKEELNNKINRLDLAKNLLKHYAMLKDNIEIVFVDLH